MIEKPTRLQNQHEVSTTSIVETALQVAEERRRILEQMRDALLSNDIEALKRLASMLCGLEDD